jgi:uncharacterized protein (TIGR00725 family)
MGDKRRLQIGVLGASAPGAELARAAERIGELIAREGAALVCGGLGGVMEAAAKGAAAVGGVTVGVLPGSDPDEANPFIGIAVATDMGHARNAIIVRSCDAAIAVGGGFGTLSEIALAMKCGVPVVGYKTWDARGGEGLAAPAVTAATPEEAVRRALAEARRRRVGGSG